MILQALNSYYDHLVRENRLERLGWQSVKVSYALEIDDLGRLVRVFPLLSEVERGKKKVMAPRELNVPAQAKRAVGIVANFLCDNASYLLGADDKGKPERSVKCFQASKALHGELLRSVQSASARAVILFFERWNPEQARDNAALRPYMDDILSGSNLVFSYGGDFVHQDGEIQSAWDRCFAGRGEGEMMRCLVTGELAHIARLHPSIKGVMGGQSSGTSLVSFNAPAFESFGRDGGQGLNAPVSEPAAFAYTSALNYMIAASGHHIHLSDTTVVFWAESGEDAYAQFGSCMLGEPPLNEEDLRVALDALAKGRRPVWNEVELDPEERFYILGLVPNAARLSVRFFLQDSFGAFARNLWTHHERLRIVKPAYDRWESLSFWQLLNETVNQKSKDKRPSPILSGALVRAVLSGMPYPRLLLDQVELRIRAEHSVTRGRAAIIKAYLMRNATDAMKDGRYKEALCVELNEQTNYPPYLLGRLFSILEGLQQAANPGINTTIRDRFFNSACSTPAVVFPQLLKLAQAHLKKLGGGAEAYYSRMLGDIIGRIETDYPSRLNLYDQGIFQIGYYHQTQARYTKKEEKKDV